MDRWERLVRLNQALCVAASSLGLFLLVFGDGFGLVLGSAGALGLWRLAAASQPGVQKAALTSPSGQLQTDSA